MSSPIAGDSAESYRDSLYQLSVPGRYYRSPADGQVLCEACGHCCVIAPGSAGRCRMRFNDGGVLKVPYGYVAGLSADPVEKKPFYHLFAGRPAMSFGMLGCNYHCDFCQNWHSSQVLRDPAARVGVQRVSAEQIVALARRAGAPLLTSTYNEPLITSEWAVDVFRAGAGSGLIGSYVSNGHASESIVQSLRPYVHAMNVDLKTFDADQYRSLGGDLEVVRRTIRQLHRLGVWVEVVTLVVPGWNDGPEQLRAMAEFLVDISPDLPWHLSGFHGSYHRSDVRATMTDQLIGIAEMAQQVGLRYVYIGNRRDVGRWSDTRCAGCGATLIRRQGFAVQFDRFADGWCADCGRCVPGFWSKNCYHRQKNQGQPAWLVDNGASSV